MLWWSSLHRSVLRRRDRHVDLNDGGAMSTKTPHGEGSIYRRHDHPTCPPLDAGGKRPKHRCQGRWTASIELPPSNGKRRRATFFGDSHADVKQKLQDARQRLTDGGPTRDSKTKLADAIIEWIRTTLEASDRKRTTKDTYTILLRTHAITDPIAALQLGRLGAADIEQFILRLRAKGLSTSTIRQTDTVLRQVLDTAVRDGFLATNPASTLRRPTVVSPEARALAPNEVSALLTASRGSRYEPLLRVLAATGLRRGEALALRWSDIDLNRRLLTVRGTLARTGSGLQVQPPKTERSRRTIPISTATAEVLQAVLDSQAVARGECGSSWIETGLVFTTEFGQPLDPRNASRAMSIAARKAGLDGVGIHTLRHTAASTMLEAGVPLRTVSEILGHGSVQVTGDIYGHVSSEGARAAVDRLAAVLGW